MVLFFFLLALLFACTHQSTDHAMTPLVEKGRGIYQANCLACHNPNPKLDGALGPAVHGSSKELLQKRIISASYPAGYQPKRNSKTMPTMPHLTKDIEALEAFLNQ